MDHRGDVETSEARFAGYVESLAGALGHADRVGPLRAYCTGLILPGERKSVEPMAARVDPGRVQAAHQSLHHFVAKAEWSDEALLAVVRARVLPAIERQGPIRAWIIDDTGFPKKGRHSVGVTRQYCGQIGKQDNCQIAVTLSVANAHASLPVACRLYLPEAWAQDPERRAKAGVPDEVAFRTKPEIALDEIRAMLQAGVSPGVVLADAGYGVDTAFRTTLTEMGLSYILGIQSSTTLWPPGTAPLPPKRWSGKGRPPTRIRRDPHHAPLSARDLAKTLPDEAWKIVTWRESTWRESQPNTGSRPCRMTRRLPTLSSRPSCAGASSGTTRTSSRNSGSGTTRGEAGGASTTMQRCASQLTDSWSPNGAGFPPQGPSRGRPSKHLAYPAASDPAAPPIRPERHVAHSITTLRISLARSLARRLQRCPCCQRKLMTQ
jgi:SRSO17 transposase